MRTLPALVLILAAALDAEAETGLAQVCLEGPMATQACTTRVWRRPGPDDAVPACHLTDPAGCLWAEVFYERWRDIPATSRIHICTLDLEPDAPGASCPGNVNKPWTLKTDVIEAAPCAGPIDGPNDECGWLEAATFVAYVGDPRTFRWVPHADDLPRRARLIYRVEIREFFTRALEETITTAPGVEEFTWTPVVSGHYVLEVDACDPDMAEEGEPFDPAEHCSDKAVSTNPNAAPPDFPGWVVFARLRPPTDGGIE